MIKKLLTVPTENLGRFARFIILQLKMWYYCARLLRQNHAGRQAAALSYHTIFGIIPLTIVMFMVFQWLGAFSEIGPRVRDFLYEQTYMTLEYPNPDDPNQTVTLAAKIDQIATSFYEKLDKGSLTVISGALVIWAALALLTTIERTFNSIWHVVRGRSFVNRIVNYWTLLTLGPLLLGLGLYVGAMYQAAGVVKTNILFYIGPAVPFLIAVATFFFLYRLMPNTAVRPKAAIWGALVAALVWTFAKYGFSTYVNRFIPYSKVYGILGLIPLGVLWIYITWLIVLFGLQLTFTTQHLKTLDAAERTAARKPDEYFLANDLTVIDIMRQIVRAFKAGRGPVAAGVICSKLDLPAEFGEKILDRLVVRGLLLKTTEPAVGFVPATAAEAIRLSDIAEAVGDMASQQTAQTSEVIKQIEQARRDLLAQYTLGQLLNER